MSPVQLSSKCLSELAKIIEKAKKQKDDKLAEMAKAAFDDLRQRMDESKKSNQPSSPQK